VKWGQNAQKIKLKINLNDEWNWRGRYLGPSHLKMDAMDVPP